MDVAVDQARKHRLVLEVDDGRAGVRRRDVPVMDGDDPSLVDDDGRWSAHRLARHGDQPPGVDVGRRCSRARSSSHSSRERE